MSEHDLVLVVDFGAQYAQLIARRVREAKVYSEIVPHTMPVAEMLARQPKAIVLSGGPSSVYEPGAPALDGALFDGGVAVFGMCYGFQAMAQSLGGEVSPTGAREYGRTPVNVVEPGTLLGRPSRAAQRVDVPRRLRDRRTGGLHAAGLDGRHAGGGVRGRRPQVRRRPVAPRGAAHRARPAGPRALPARDRGLPADLDDAQHRRRAGRGHPRADRRRPRDLRVVGRRRLRRGGGDRPARDRRPADVRVRRPRDDAPGRDRAGPPRLRGRLRHPRRGRRERPVPRRPRGDPRSRGEAQDHRPRVHPRLRGRRGARLR